MLVRNNEVSNWYKKAQSMHRTHDRFFYNVRVAVWVPEGVGQEEGWTILRERLKRIAGPSETDTPGISANITIEGIEKI